MKQIAYIIILLIPVTFIVWVLKEETVSDWWVLLGLLFAPTISEK